MIRSGFDRGKAERGERGKQRIIVVVEDELLSSESASPWEGDGADVVRGVARSCGFWRVGHHGFWRGEVVGEVERVDEMTAPIRELAATRFPEGAPAARRNIIAVGNLLFQRPSPEVPVEIGGEGVRW